MQAGEESRAFHPPCALNVARMRLCASRAVYVWAYPREAPISSRNRAGMEHFMAKSLPYYAVASPGWFPARCGRTVINAMMAIAKAAEARGRLKASPP